MENGNVSAHYVADVSNLIYIRRLHDKVHQNGRFWGCI